MESNFSTPEAGVVRKAGELGFKSSAALAGLLREVLGALGLTQVRIEPEDHPEGLGLPCVSVGRLTIWQDKTEGEGPLGIWRVDAAIYSGGSREQPPDVDISEVHQGPNPWVAVTKVVDVLMQERTRGIVEMLALQLEMRGDA